MIEMKLSELTARLGGTLTGDGERIVRGVGPLGSAGADEVSFLANSRYEKHVAASAAAAVIVADDYSGPGESLIRCEDPYFAFREAMVAFHGFRRPHFDDIDPRANVDPTAQLGDGVRVAAFATIADGCRIGAQTVIYPGVYVGPNCRVGCGCAIYPNAVLYDGTILGDRVTIHANSSIGQDGFGYATHDGKHHKIPQTGCVEIGDDVEIGSGCAIERATMGKTVIGAGTKFADLVGIGHGTVMGRHCLMVSQAGISGSVTVGDYCVFAGQAGTVGHITIGDGVKVLAQAGVTNDIPPGQEVLGSPAIPRAQARRSFVVAKRLPQIREELVRLNRELEAIKRRLDIGDGDGEKPSQGGS